MRKYRVMVTGEDGVLFCTKNNVKETELDDEFDHAQENYPYGRVFIELENEFVFFDDDNNCEEYY